MRRFLVVLVLAGCASATAPSASAATLTGTGVTVVALGDSITHGCCAPIPWFTQVMTDPKLGPGYNAGVGGNTTAQMLTRLDADVLSHRPIDHETAVWPGSSSAVSSAWLVLIMGGTNDVNGGISPSITMANLKAIIDRLRGAGAQIVLLTIPPMDATLKPWRAKVPATNAAIRVLAAKRGVPLVDIYPALANPDGTCMAGMFDSDGVHPDQAGHDVIAQLVRSRLAAMRL